MRRQMRRLPAHQRDDAPGHHLGLRAPTGLLGHWPRRHRNAQLVLDLPRERQGRSAPAVGQVIGMAIGHAEVLKLLGKGGLGFSHVL